MLTVEWHSLSNGPYQEKITTVLSCQIPTVVYYLNDNYLKDKKLWKVSFVYIKNLNKYIKVVDVINPIHNRIFPGYEHIPLGSGFEVTPSAIKVILQYIGFNVVQSKQWKIW
eukprot:257676_1